MKTKLFSDQIEPACAYCRHGDLSKDGKMILCPKKGIVPGYYKCRMFVYSPLKRIPKKPSRIPSYDQSDFEL
ncbi:hypothetical protein H8711_00910 [Clostridiaceae bacterium NSJ-31]|uniref:Uncharacterized protein n=1 Tax=Ligaoa zhengdingensis TaxID=2763658 RepID=A0A926I3U0_9FIRM|nr:hypothetical protein [Ligaoa zhengdingensis]MBC8545496.1 hypothetical protein [Ligaoa zhengdingensis]